MYVDKSLRSSELPSLSRNEDWIETCGVRISLNETNTITVLGVYRPPQLPCDENFGVKLDDLLRTNLRPSDDVYVVGDLNVDLLQESVSRAVLHDVFGSLSFFQLITEATHHNVNYSDSLLDHVWTNNNVNASSGVLNVDITDHFPIFLELPIISKSRKTFKTFRDHSKQSIESLISDVGSSFEAKISSFEGDFDSKVEFFLGSLFEVYNKHCPLRTKPLSAVSSYKPWLTDSLLERSNTKHLLFRLYKHGDIAFSDYNRYKNKLTSDLRRAKRDYHRHKFANCSGDSRRTWSAVNYILRGNVSHSGSMSITANDVSVTDPEEVANAFNGYFCSVAGDLDSRIPVTDIDPVSYMSPAISDSVYVTPSTPSDVSRIISSLALKGCDSSSIPSYVYKSLSSVLSPIISNLFNQSVQLGVFPSCLKIARVVPIHKAGSKELLNNYRPISTLPLLSKIFEKLMIVRLNSFLSHNNVIQPRQFGFMKDHNTADAILEFCDGVYEASNSGGSLLSVFLDFSKAFDTVKHSILLSKLQHYGIRGVTNDWFRSYLSGRSQFVEVNGVGSDRLDVHFGVPQGSVLGPLLFLLYINDMENSSSELRFIHFADDTTVFLSGSDADHLCDLLNVELGKIDLWLQTNRLSLNISKTCYMLFTRNVVSITRSVQIRNAPLVRVKSCKFLGLIIDEGLSFLEHTRKVSGRVLCAVGAMYKLSSYVSKVTLKQIYFSLLYSHLTYAITVWGFTFDSYLKRIISGQRRAVSLLKTNSESTESTFKQLFLFNFNSVLKYFTIVKIHRSLNNPCQHYFIDKIISFQTNHDHCTRFKADNKITTPLLKTSFCQRSFLYRGILLWNSLPIDLRSCVDLDRFKMLLRKHLLSLQ